jgi:hypothetical protein
VLTIEPPFYLVRGTTIFRDHEDPDQFYFLPGGPQLTSFTLYKYRVSISVDGSDPTRAPGAGMALFEVEVPPPDLTVIEEELSSASGRDKPRLSPVMFRSAEVNAIVAGTDGDKLVNNLFETHAAPLVLPHHTAFALSLTAEGATLMQKAATAPHDADGGAASTAIPVGVVYELRFLALTPALHARVTMHYEEAYNHFSASLAFTYYYAKAALDLDISWLVEHDFIKIEIIEFTDAEDAERQRTLVMNLVTARIQRDFFHSGLPQTADSPAPSGPLASLLNSGTSGNSGTGGSSINSGSAMFVLKAKYEVDNQSKSFVFTFDSRTAVELTHVISGHLASLAAGSDPRILTIDTHDDFFSRLDVKVLSVVDFGALADLRDAVVDVSFSDVRNSYALGAQAGGPFTFSAALAHPDEDQYTWGATYDFDLNEGLGPARMTAGPFDGRSRVLVVDPQLHFRYRQVRFSLGPLDPAQVPRIHVRARVRASDPSSPDLATDTFVLDTKDAEHVLRVHAALAEGPLTVLVRASWEDPHGNIHDGDEVEVVSDTFLILGPYVDVIPLFVSPAVDWSQVSQVVIEIRYQDGAYGIDKTLDFNAHDPGGQHLDLPLLDAAKRTYSWRQTVFRLDGTSTQSDLVSADASVLAPAWQKPTTADLHIVWVGSPGDAFGLRVDVWAETPSGDEQQVSAFLRTGVDGDKVVTLPLDGDGKLSYRYQAAKISTTGETPVRSATAQTAPLLVVQTS